MRRKKSRAAFSPHPDERMSLLRNARVVLTAVALIILGLAAWRYFHSEPAEPRLEVTNGSRVRVECAGISFAPEAGWGMGIFDSGKTDPARPRLCSPMLKRPEASITVLVLPKDPATLEEQAGAFLAKLALQEQKQEAVVTSSGLKAVHAAGISTKTAADAGPDRRIQLDLFFLLNAEGRVAVVYETGLPGAAEPFIAWFSKTVRLEPQ
jgi:hypothetical protein